MWSGRRRSAKTGRLSSAPDAASPSLSLAKTLLLRKELLDAFVVYIDADSLTALCKAMAQTHCHVDLAHFNVHRSVILRGGSFVLSDYLSLRSQLERFNRCVQVVEGDLGTVTAVGGQLVECLVFPTSYTYRNPHRGVAGRIHERAGPDLDQAVANIGTRYSAAAGSVKCTVGCGSGMRLLVHCVGPVADHPDSDEVLYKTYVLR
uniref:Macro domain-containing protein n=1 Tax=Phytophthora ramorum TaxID=164328 RepID=H3HE20_PHYRM